MSTKNEQFLNEMKALKAANSELNDQITSLKAQNNDLIDTIVQLKDKPRENDFLNNSAFITAQIDNSFNFINVNEAFAKSDNKKTADYTGKNVFELYPDEKISQLFKHTLETKETCFSSSAPFIFIDNSGKGERYYDWSLQPILRDGEVSGFFFFLFDVTARVASERRLRMELDAAHEYLDTTNMIIVVLNRDETVNLINRSGCEILGLQKEQIIGKNWFSRFLTHRTEEEARGAFNAILYKEEYDKYRYFEYSILDAKRNERLIGWYNNRLYENGKTIGLLSVGEDITKRKSLENRLNSSHFLLQTLMDYSPDSIYFKDKSHKFVKLNKAKAEHNQMQLPEEMIGRRDSDYLSDNIAQEAEEDEKRIMLTGEPLINKVELLKKKNNSTCWASTTKVPWYDQSGDIIGTIGISRDITNEKNRELELQQNYHTQNVLNSILQCLMESLTLDEILYKVLEMLATLPWLALDPKGCIFLVDEDDILTMKADYKLSKELLVLCEKVPFGKCLCGKAALRKEIVFHDSITDDHDIQFNGMKPHGHYCVPIIFKEKLFGVLNLYVSAGYKRTDKEDLFLTSVAKTLANIIEFKRIEEKVGHMATYDSLTGIPNRSLFYDRLHHIITHAKRYDHKFALIFIDLDSFKPINDTFGHDAGDMLLKEVVVRIQECIRDSDTIARIGGDEFVLILPYILNKSDVVAVVSKIIKRISSPYNLNGIECSTSASMGVSIFPDNGEEFQQILKSADTAMYEAKKEGGDSFRFYRDKNS